MPALDTLKGSTLRGIWFDAPEHHVTIALRVTRAGVPVDYSIVLEGVTEFGFHDDTPAPWPNAEVTEIHSRNAPDSMRLDFSFGSGSAGLGLTCARVVMHRTRPAQ